MFKSFRQADCRTRAVNGRAFQTYRIRRADIVPGGDACHLEPIPCSKVYATCDTPRIFSACLVDESGSHDLTELTGLFGVVGFFPHHPQLLPSYFSTQKLKFCGEYVSVYCAYIYVPECMEKQPTMPGSRLENGKFHNKRA